MFNVVCNFCLRFLSSRLFCCCVSDTQRQQLQLHLLPLAAISLLHVAALRQNWKEEKSLKIQGKFSDSLLNFAKRFAQS